MVLTLKSYQQSALAAIENFLTAARGATTENLVATAFAQARRAALGESAPRVVYRRFSASLPAVPQACIRIPTGGGKTLLAAHAIERASRLYVGTQYPLALWLVPSNTIRTQTLEALKKQGHPYRQALEQYFPADRLIVIDIDDCEQLRPDDFAGSAIVIVGTLQTLRVGNTASRKVYAYKETFEPHFVRLPRDADYFETVTQADLDEQPYLKSSDLGRVKFSFANLLAHHRPIVIVDEAHNAATSLSTETLTRLRPACVLEWTATPAQDQNVLYTVSALALKAEHMIKLPIALQGHANWQEAMRDAVLTRDRLAAEAANEPDYIRPIVLFQADSRDGEVPVDALKTYLTDQLSIKMDRIAIATGSQRELDGIDLFDPTCKIDFVITVEALKEGWDCSFAYVFATVQTIRSTKELEQLVGRVLRLPYAAPRLSPHLNRAYAHVSSPATIATADRLVELLVNMGFEQYEAITAVEPTAGDLFGSSTDRRPTPPPLETTFALPERGAESVLAASAGSIRLEREGEGYKATVTGIVPIEAIDAAVAAAPSAQRERLRATLAQHRTRALAAASPQQRGAHLAPIPQLVIPLQGDLVLFEPEVLRDFANFSLAGRDATIAPLPDRPDAPAYLIDVDGVRVNFRTEVISEQLSLDMATDGIRREDVIRTLNRKLRRTDILQADLIAWLGRAVDSLLSQGKTLTWLARHINYVSDALGAKLDGLQATAQREVFQQTLRLDDNDRKPRLDAGFEFRFPEDNYAPSFRYNGRYTFQKHFFGPPGELDDDITGEETACAIALDQLPETRHWVRNLERRSNSFRLPTSTDWFYPDFIAELSDGRILVVEYKGAHLYSNDDSREKRDIGGVWAAASNRRCLFSMVTGQLGVGARTVAQQIMDAIA